MKISSIANLFFFLLVVLAFFSHPVKAIRAGTSDAADLMSTVGTASVIGGSGHPVSSAVGAGVGAIVAPEGYKTVGCFLGSVLGALVGSSSSKENIDRKHETSVTFYGTTGVPAPSKGNTNIVFRVLMTLKDGTEEPLVADSNDHPTLHNVDIYTQGRMLRMNVRAELSRYLGADTINNIRDIKLKHKGYTMGEYETVKRLVLRSENYVPDWIYMTVHLSFPYNWHQQSEQRHLRIPPTYINTYDPPMSYPAYFRGPAPYQNTYDAPLSFPDAY